jgi:hypothetical protein
VLGLRLAATVLVKRTRRKRAPPDAPIPWLPIVVTTAIAMVLVVVGWVVLRTTG